jgi:hypothetical protein
MMSWKPNDYFDRQSRLVSSSPGVSYGVPVDTLTCRLCGYQFEEVSPTPQLDETVNDPGENIMYQHLARWHQDEVREDHKPREVLHLATDDLTCIHEALLYRCQQYHYHPPSLRCLEQDLAERLFSVKDGTLERAHNPEQP